MGLAPPPWAIPGNPYPWLDRAPYGPRERGILDDIADLRRDIPSITFDEAKQAAFELQRY